MLTPSRDMSRVVEGSFSIWSELDFGAPENAGQKWANWLKIQALCGLTQLARK